VGGAWLGKREERIIYDGIYGIDMMDKQGLAWTNKDRHGQAQTGTKKWKENLDRIGRAYYVWLKS